MFRLSGGIYYSASWLQQHDVPGRDATQGQLDPMQLSLLSHPRARIIRKGVSSQDGVAKIESIAPHAFR